MKALAILATISVLIATNIASAGTYSGNWPITVTNAQYGNGTYCLTVRDDGSLRFPHSGFVSLNAPGGNLPYGTFELIGHSFTVTVQEQGENQNAGLVLVARADNGSIANGIYDQVYGGEELDSGKAVFGPKGGC